MLVLGLGESDNRRLSLNGLTVTDDGVGLLKRYTSVVLLEILIKKTINIEDMTWALKMELTFKQISK